MIDTIKAYQDLGNIGLTKQQAEDYFNRVSPKIVWGGYSNNKRFGTTSSFRMYVTHNKLMIEGSLCKFYHGNNIQTLTRGQTIEALEKLEALIQFPLDGFILSRLDFSDNITTDKSVSTYINAFESIDKFNTEKYHDKEDATGKYFNQGKRSLLLYNKPKEIHHKRRRNRGALPINKEKQLKQNIEDEQIRSRGNVLRIEYRYLKNVSSQMKLKPAKLVDLKDKNVYKHLVREWFKVICKIRYREHVLPDLNMISGTKDLERALMIAGIEFFGGQSAILNAIRKYRSTHPSTKSKKSRLAKRVKELSVNTLLDSFGKELFDEVRRKALKLALIQIGRRQAG